MGVVAKYVGLLKARGRFIIGVVFVVGISLAVLSSKLSSTTTTSFSAAPGTRSYRETEEIKSTFPSVFDDRETAIVLCNAPANCTCSNASDCAGFRTTVYRLLEGLQGYAADGTLRSATTFFDFVGPLSPLGSAYYNASAKAMLIGLQFSKGSGVSGEAQVNKAMTYALASAERLSVDGWTLRFSGQLASSLSSTDEIGPIIGASDGTGMVFIVLLFGWQVRSWRLCWIPILNTVLCLLIARGLIYPLSVSGLIILPSYVPNVCLFLSIALSVDYSFFHLSRFQEARRDNMELEEAVAEMVITAGRVVLVSGVVLLFCWLALAAFPVFGINTLGYCSAITIFCCIVVNLIMNPAMILVFPRFFGNTKQNPWHCCLCCRHRDQEAVQTWTHGSLLVTHAEVSAPTNNCYRAVGKVATAMPGMLLLPLLVYALLLPGVFRLFSANFVVGGVSGESSSTAFGTDMILADFPQSRSGVPLTVMLSAPPHMSVKSEEYFRAGSELVRELQRETGFDASRFRGIMIRARVGSEVSFLEWAQARQLLESTVTYGWAWKQSVNSANTSSLFIVTPPYDAFSDEAKALVGKARAAVARFQSMPKASQFTVAAFHPMAIEVDAENLTVKRFPIVVAITVLIVFGLIGLRYKAALIPFKLLFTIAVPIMSTLGMGVFVFQDGVLNWTGIPSLHSDGGLVWINPVACTFMLIGFGLDYDIFLFSRIYASRKSGEFRNDREAIIDAVAATGPVISTAGCIMALAFVGMVVQHSNEFLCQMGFTMIFGVLMDTFVVRTLLVPAFLSMAGRFNWWPGRMPAATRPSTHIETGAL